MRQRPRGAVRREAGDHGVRRGAALGRRLSDLHFLPTSTSLGCQIDGPHLHVVPRVNSNRAGSRTTSGESCRSRRPDISTSTPSTGTNAGARETPTSCSDPASRAASDPLKLHGGDDLLSRLSRRTGRRSLLTCCATPSGPARRRPNRSTSLPSCSATPVCESTQTYLRSRHTAATESGRGRARCHSSSKQLGTQMKGIRGALVVGAHQQGEMMPRRSTRSISGCVAPPLGCTTASS